MQSFIGKLENCCMWVIFFALGPKDVFMVKMFMGIRLKYLILPGNRLLEIMQVSSNRELFFFSNLLPTAFTIEVSQD